MMLIIDVMKREDTLIRLVVLIFVGGGLNTLMLIFSLLEVTRNPNILFSNTNQIPFITTSPELTILYIGIGITYSIATSLSFAPKRIVSPFYIQITTSTILVAIIYSNVFITSSPTLTSDFLGGTLAVILIIYTILGVLGFLQGWIVRKMMGVNGDKENIDYKTFSINEKFDEIKEIIIDRQFLYDNDFILKKQSNDLVTIQSKNDSYEKHVLVLIPDRENQNTSILCITSYEIRYDWLKKPKTTFQRESLIGIIRQVLKSNKKIEVNFEIIGDNEIATNTALSQSLNITSSPFAKVRNYPKRHVVVIGLLLLIGSIMGVIHIYNDKIVSNDTLVNSLVFIIIVFIADIYPTIKEKFQSR